MTNDPSGTRRYLAVYLPLLPAERLIRKHIRQYTKAPEAAFVLAEKQRGAMRLAACDARALALGLAPGLALADARARVPDLAVFEHDPDADRALLEWLADGCERYTPLIMLDPPDGLILDISGCAHIWGGESPLLQNLSLRLQQAGLTSHVVIAETPDKARALARYGSADVQSTGDVKALPVQALDLGDDALHALRRAGLYTIGDLASRPRIPLATRLGLAAVVKLDRLLGGEDVRISPRRRPPALFTACRFAEPIAHSVHVMAALDNLLTEAAAALYDQAEGGRQFIVSLYRSDGDVRRLMIETGAPTRDSLLLSRLFAERIDTLADPLDPGFGYDAMRLDVPVSEPLCAEQKIGLGSQQNHPELQPLLDQLATRLGSSHVLRFVSRDTHIPEIASICVATQKQDAALPWPDVEAGEPPLRPFTLFDPPQPVEVVVADLPDGAPSAFRWRRNMHRVVLAEGPERIAPEWWRRRQGYASGDRDLTRDYFRVEDARGHRFWLFRRGLYGETEKPQWYLHGAFA